MNTDRIAYFLTVAEEGSFSAAAQRHFISQSAISLQIASLEKELGSKLFVRTASGVALTMEGRHLVPFARNLMKAEQSLLDEMERIRGEERVLSIAYSGPIEKALLTNAFIRLHEVNPKFRIKPLFYPLSDVTDAIVHHECDLALSIPVEMHSENIQWEVVAEYETCAAVSAVNPLANEKEVLLQDLLPWPFVILAPSASSAAASEVRDWAIHAGFQADSILCAENIDEQLFMISMNQAVSIFPDCAATRVRGIRLIPITDYQYTHQTIAAYLKKTPTIDALITAIRNTAHEIERRA